jgi:transcriptional regulator with XRE-family HTH domain
MSFGKQILRLRIQSKTTQQEISELTGLAVSYLSRLENNHVTPSIRTLSKISRALKVPVSAFFDSEPVLEASDRCPVSTSGECILDQMLVARGRKPDGHREGYSPHQLEILRQCNFLLHTGDREIVTSLSTMIKSLLALSITKSRKHKSLGAKYSPSHREE